MDFFRRLGLLFCLLTAGCTTLKNPYFYELEYKGVKSYALGTMHIGFEANELPKEILAHQDKAQTFATEFHPAWADKSPDELQKEKNARHATRYLENRKSGFKPMDQLTPQTAKAVKLKLVEGLEQGKFPSFTSQAKFKSQEFEHMTPEMILGFLALASDKRSYEFADRDVVYGLRHGRIDNDLYNRAKANKVMLHLDDETALTEDCEDKMHLRSIENYIATGELKNGSVVELYEVYERGDEQELAALTSDIPEGWVQCVFGDRNKKWADKIADNYELRAPIFIAVGAGHLVGKNSLFTFLKELGFSVRRVSFAKN